MQVHGSWFFPMNPFLLGHSIPGRPGKRTATGSGAFPNGQIASQWLLMDLLNGGFIDFTGI